MPAPAPTLPQMLRLRQRFPETPPIDIEATIRTEFDRIRPRLRPGQRIAIATGSRGIAGIDRIVGGLAQEIRSTGASPCVIPAMGSHGGATPEGQTQLLADYGITEQTVGAPILASMETVQIGSTPAGIPVHVARQALESDGILVVNRVKPHTDFQGTLGSGLIKMIVIGLGKHAGAAATHQAASWHGYETAIRAAARIVLQKAPVLGGIAIVENPRHETARLELVPAADIEARESGLLEQARALMPRLPFDELDLLIVDQIGKNISGAGMDPNVTGRWVHGYTTELARSGRPGPFIRRIFVRDLTPETHGNAIGIGLADFTTERLVAAMDKRVTYVNTLTALTPNGAKIPIHFPSDRTVIEAALASVGRPDTAQATIVRIRDTLSLDLLEVSESLLETTWGRRELEQLSEPAPWTFSPEGNLPPL